MADTSVKYFHSEMVGAPVLSGTPGALIAVLDACLVNGFGLKTVDSLVVAGNVATANISAGHSAEVGSVVLISGASPSALNGEQKVTATTINSVSFATTGITDQTATGTITSIMAPAKWNKQFTDTNLAVYKSLDVLATGCALQMDDTGATNGRCIGYESMSSISVGTGAFPLPSQLVGGNTSLYWPKSATADAKARRWVLAADSRMFYFFVFSSDAYVDALASMAFGDIIPVKSGDPFSCILQGSLQDQAASLNANGASSMMYSASATAACYAPRSYTGLGGSLPLRKMFSTFCANNEGVWSGVVGGVGTPFPNPADGGLYACPYYVSEASLSLRGVFPGFYCCPQTIPQGALLNNGYITGVTGLAGRLVRTVTGYNNPVAGQILAFIDNTGPWR